LNTSIRVIAGAFYSNNSSNSINLTMPTATASNDYLVIEYGIGYEAASAFYSYPLLVTFPSTNTFSQNQCTLISYYWDSNSSYWTVNDFRASTTSYIA
jgi:hypothetical protein